MTQSVHISVHVAVAAGAGVRRVALGRARWRRDNILIAVHMRNHRHSLRPGLAAAGAGEGLDASLGLSGRFRHHTIIPCVAERRNRAGKGLVAVLYRANARFRAWLGAGGFCFYCPFAEAMHNSLPPHDVIPIEFTFYSYL